MNFVRDSSFDYLYPNLSAFPIPVRDDEDAQQWTPYLLHDWRDRELDVSLLEPPVSDFYEYDYTFPLNDNMPRPTTFLSDLVLSDSWISSILARTPPPPIIFGPTHDTITVSSPSTPPFGSRDHPWPSPNPNTSHEPENSRIQLRRGPIVPQKRYEPSTLSDRRRYVDEVDLEPSIVFNMHDPHEEGFPLKAAMKGHFSRLVSRDDLMFQGWSSSVSIRINWPGYRAWSRQIPTRDFQNPPATVSRAKLAKNVAKSIARFIAEHKGRSMGKGGDRAWRVGPGKIDVSDLVLMRLDHVSKGSWQAQLRLIRPRS